MGFFDQFRGLEFSFISEFRVQDKCTAYCTVVLTVNQFLKVLVIRIAAEVQTSGRGTKEIHLLVL